MHSWWNIFLNTEPCINRFRFGSKGTTSSDIWLYIILAAFIWIPTCSWFEPDAASCFTECVSLRGTSGQAVLLEAVPDGLANRELRIRCETPPSVSRRGYREL